MGKCILAAAAALLLWSGAASAQADRREVRRGNREFRKENYQKADISYRKALMADSLSFAAAYNLGNTLYREGDMEQAGSVLGRMAETAPSSEHAADYYFNAGDVALQRKDYKAAVDAFHECLLRDPGDLSAKENYIYAREMLRDDENKNGGDDGGQNGNDDNKDKDNDGGQNGNDDNKDKDNGNDGNNDNDNNDNDNNNDGSGGQDMNDGDDGDDGRDVQGGLSSQQAQQLLQAIQAKEKETQDKVNKKKAAVLKSRQKEKNW